MKKNSQITAIGKYAMNLIETYFDENKPHRVFLVRGKHSFISSGAEIFFQICLGDMLVS